MAALGDGWGAQGYAERQGGVKDLAVLAEASVDHAGSQLRDLAGVVYSVFFLPTLHRQFKNDHTDDNRGGYTSDGLSARGDAQGAPVGAQGATFGAGALLSPPIACTLRS